jgi:hypothetical protein
MKHCSSISTHLTFLLNLQSLLEPESITIKIRLIHRIKELLIELGKEEQLTLKNTSKRKFLELLLTSKLINDIHIHVDGAGG